MLMVNMVEVAMMLAELVLVVIYDVCGNGGDDYDYDNDDDEDDDDDDDVDENDDGYACWVHSHGVPQVIDYNVHPSSISSSNINISNGSSNCHTQLHHERHHIRCSPIAAAGALISSSSSLHRHKPLPTFKSFRVARLET
jgi:hypothetical protein